MESCCSKDLSMENLTKLFSYKISKKPKKKKKKRKNNKKTLLLFSLQKSSKKKKKQEKNLEFCSRFLISAGFVTHPKIDKKNSSNHCISKKYRKSHFKHFFFFLYFLFFFVSQTCLQYINKKR